MGKEGRVTIIKATEVWEISCGCGKRPFLEPLEWYEEGRQRIWAGIGVRGVVGWLTVDRGAICGQSQVKTTAYWLKEWMRARMSFAFIFPTWMLMSPMIISGKASLGISECHVHFRDKLINIASLRAIYDLNVCSDEWRDFYLTWADASAHPVW